MVLIKRSVRASSVPVGRVSGRLGSDESYLMDVDNVATARRISTAAFDDTDALMSASKRHDQQLLDDINAKLATASFSQPVSVKRSTTMTTQYSSPRTRDKPPLPTTTLRGRYLLHSDVDDDIDDALASMPATPATTSVIRSSGASTGSRARRGVGSGYHVTRTDSHVIPLHQHDVPVYEKVVYDTNHPLYSMSSSAYLSADVPAGLTLTPVADLAVRQAHRNLDRIDKEIKHTYAPDGPHTFSSKTYVAEVLPAVVRGSSVRVPLSSSTYGGGGGSAVMVTRRTSSVPPSRPSGVQLLRHRAASPSPSASDLLLIASSVSPPPPVVLPVTPARAHVYAPSVSELQHQMKVDLLKTSGMDADLPPLHTTVYKHRTEPVLPYSAYVAPRSAHVTTSVIAAPVVLPPAPPTLVQAPTEYASMPQPISVRPRVSETRRKVREVLCKIKKDPHYFD